MNWIKENKTQNNILIFPGFGRGGVKSIFQIFWGLWGLYTSLLIVLIQLTSRMHSLNESIQTIIDIEKSK